MAEYKQTNVAGTAFNRFKRIVIENPYQGTPRVVAIEEQVRNFADGVTELKEVDAPGKAFDPAEQFDELNPANGEKTGRKINAADVYVAIYSYVMTMAKQRDAQNV